MMRSVRDAEVPRAPIVCARADFGPFVILPDSATRLAAVPLRKSRRFILVGTLFPPPCQSIGQQAACQRLTELAERRPITDPDFSEKKCRTGEFGCRRGFMMRHVVQPGAPLPERVQWVEARGRAFSFPLEAGLPLLTAVRRGF